ncbi:MAG: Fur family transcriptional regulator [Acidobacteriota bacterium]
MADERERQRFLSGLRQRGMRVTSERLALFDEIFTLHGHIDAEHLVKTLKARGAKISRATVYRNLELLVDFGLVHRHRLGRNRFLYEHVHEGLRHDHLVCAGCGRVVEFVSPGISALQGEICRAHGFAASQHSLQITGMCLDCADSGDQPPSPRPAEEAHHPAPAVAALGGA